MTLNEPGLCSVTLRALDPAEVARHAANAGLRSIEWGADVHAPPDDESRLAEVCTISAEYGLSICSYGSYWRAGQHDETAVRSVIAAATALGTSRIRVWAGSVGSAEADQPTWARVTAAAQDAADRAADAGCALAFEFHGDTLADTPASTLELLERVGRDNVGTYWQPPLDLPAAAAVTGLRAVLEHVSAVHVFSWWPATQRLPLRERADLWRAALAVLAGHEQPVDLLLEFVPDDDPAVLGVEARTLASWVADAS